MNEDKEQKILDKRRAAGKLYDPWKLDGGWETIQPLIQKFNQSEWWHDRTALDEMRKGFGESYDDLFITPPFHCDHGFRIHFGRHVYVNTGLIILDEADVTFGDHVLIGPRVSIFTAGHPIDPDVRPSDLEYAWPVTIGDRVWIGGNVVINPGVTIGEGSVIASGAVVTQDIPAGVIAGGVPARVIREIGEEDRRRWKQEEADFRSSF